MKKTTTGLLYKRSEYVKRWRTRYFMLEEETDDASNNNNNNNKTKCLTYYIPLKDDSMTYKSPETVPRGVVLLPEGSIQKCVVWGAEGSSHCVSGDGSGSSVKDGVIMEPSSGKVMYAFELYYLDATGDATRKIYLAATSKEDRVRWMQALMFKSSGNVSDVKEVVVEKDEVVEEEILKTTSNAAAVPAAAEVSSVTLMEASVENVQSTVATAVVEEKEEEVPVSAVTTEAVPSLAATTEAVPSLAAAAVEGIAVTNPNEASEAPATSESEGKKVAEDVSEKTTEANVTSVSEVGTEVVDDIVKTKVKAIAASLSRDSQLQHAPPNPAVFENLDADLVTKLGNTIDKFLQMCDEPLESWTDDENPQAKIFVKRGVKVVQRAMPDSNIMRGDAVVSYHPKLIFDAILDLNKKKVYEKHLHCAARLKEVNNHTFIDYLRYVGTWPATARDFCYLAHWRILPERNNAIVIVAINHEDEQLCPLRTDAIRGDIHLSGYLLTPIYDDDGICRSCNFQRISAINVKGIVPNVVTQKMDQGSALFPSKVARYLDARFESTEAFDDEERLMTGEISDSILIEDVLSYIPKKFDVVNDNVLVDHQAEKTDSQLENLDEVMLQDERSVDTSKEKLIQNIAGVMILVASIILTPLSVWLLSGVVRRLSSISITTLMRSLAIGTCSIICFSKNAFYFQKTTSHTHKSFNRILKFFSLSLVFFLPFSILELKKSSEQHIWHWEICFLITLVYSIRSAILYALGTPVYHTSSCVKVNMHTHRHLGTGPVTSRFSIDLKRILHYVSEKKRLNRTPGESSSMEGRHDISVTHVTIKAVAKALSEMPSLNARRVDIPLLGVKGFFPNKLIDVSVSTSGAAHDTVKISDVRSLSLRQVADEISNKVQNSSLSKRSSSLIPSLILGPLDYISEVFDIQDSSSYLLRGRKFGSCVIITAPDTTGKEIDIDVQPSREPGMPSVVVVIGGVRLARTRENGDSGKRSTRPSLTFSISIDSPACGIMACRKFVERVQKLLMNPENIELIRTEGSE